MTAAKTFVPYEFKLDEAGAVTVAFSRLNAIDSDTDVTFPGALPAGKAVPMSAYGHTSWDGALPVGKGTIREQGDLGILDGAFFMDTDQGRNAYNTVKAMADLQEWSYGYAVLDGGPGTFDGKRVRELRKLDVFEVSPVLKGAGVGTSTLAIKSGAPGSETPYAEHASWLREAVAAFVERSDARIEMRSKEGRKLSSADRDMLTAMRDEMRQMGMHADELDEMLMATDPNKADNIRRATIEVLLGSARANGVPI